MVGFFEIVELYGDEDAAGAKRAARAKCRPDDGHVVFLLLPPYLRTTQCGIGAGSVVFGIVDDVSGFGFAAIGRDGADFGYFFDSDLNIKKNVVIDGAATIGDSASVGADLSVSGNATAVGNVTGKDCRIAIAQGDPLLPSVVTSLATHTHNCTAPGTPSGPPIPTPIPGA